jgi:elongation factor 3
MCLGNLKKEKRVISRMTGSRRPDPNKKKVMQYEVAWEGKSAEANSWYRQEEMIKFNKIYEKVIRLIDAKCAAREAMYARPLTQGNVEKHLADTGLEPEYGTHFRIGALSGGQKVKVVIAAAMWDQPHILVLDEPTNYLDRDSLGALAAAIEEFEGGVIMITHNDAFCSHLCPERWVMEDGILNTEGDVEWMAKAAEQAVEFETIENMVDATGNEVTLKKSKLNAKDKKKVRWQCCLLVVMQTTCSQKPLQVCCRTGPTNSNCMSHAFWSSHHLCCLEGTFGASLHAVCARAWLGWVRA